MSAKSSNEPPEIDESILPDTVPVVMPEIPLYMTINTAEQFKAMSDPMRGRILHIIRPHPATAKQIATRLEATPGAIGHHLQVLEKAGMVQVVARRVTRGIIAKYYARTARIFNYDFPLDVTENVPTDVHILNQVRDELNEASFSAPDDELRSTGFSHARLSRERAQEFHERLQALLTEFSQLTPDVDGVVYSMCLSFFKSPNYLQTRPDADESE